MIKYMARPVKDKAGLLKAVSVDPSMIEIETPLGFVPVFKGTLDKLPSGAKIFAKQGTLLASFQKVGKRLVVT